MGGAPTEQTGVWDPEAGVLEPGLAVAGLGLLAAQGVWTAIRLKPRGSCLPTPPVRLGK